MNKPILPEDRAEMKVLPNRSNITTHGISYTYGDFSGVAKELLAKYFDVFFYICNFGTLQLVFSYKK